MSYPANPATTPEAAIRTWYGLSQQQLARDLGVSAAFVGHLEAHRKVRPPALEARLLPLAHGVPAPVALPYRLPPLPPPAPPAGAPAAVRQRHRTLCLLAHAVGRQLEVAQARAAAQAARHRGLTRLAALPPPAAPAEAAHRAAWLLSLTHDLALAYPDPDHAATAARLLAARLAGVRTELAHLTATSRDPYGA